MNEPVIIFDMASVRVHLAANRRSASAVTTSGETLVSVLMRPAESDRDVVYRALDAAVTSTRMLRADLDGNLTGCQVALYNPRTGCVTVGRDNGRVTYRLGATSVEPDGSYALLDSDGTLLLGTEAYLPVELSATLVQRMLSAHQH